MLRGTVKNDRNVFFNNEISDLLGEIVAIYPETAVFDRSKGIQVHVSPLNSSHCEPRPIMLQFLKVTEATRQEIINCARK